MRGLDLVSIETIGCRPFAKGLSMPWDGRSRSCSSLGVSLLCSDRDEIDHRKRFVGMSLSAPCFGYIRERVDCCNEQLGSGPLAAQVPRGPIGFRKSLSFTYS